MTVWTAAAFGAWLVLAASMSVWMGRRGHSSFAWAVIIGALGPLGLPVLYLAVRREATAAPTVLRRGMTTSAAVHVVVGIDGSAASEDALDTVRRLLGDRVGELHLATVIDYDQAERGGGSPGAVAAQGELDALAARLGDPVPTLVVLVGKPADALADYAAQVGADVVAVGSRGSGNTPFLLGSSADRLIRLSTVPVLVGGATVRLDRARGGAVDTVRV